MESAPRMSKPRISRLNSKITGRQQIVFADNRAPMPYATMQLGKSHDASKPYDQAMTEDNLLMGRETECTGVGIKTVRSAQVSLISNGQPLARSPQDERVGLPYIELQIDGCDRGVAIIEVVFGPMKGSEYTSPVFTAVRHLLYETLWQASQKKLSLDQAVKLFNLLLNEIRGSEKYTLALLSENTFYLEGAAPTNSRMIQTNLSLPFDILAEEDPMKPTMESLIPVGRKEELELFVSSRSTILATFRSADILDVAQKASLPEPSDQSIREIQSLFILVLFQNKMRTQQTKAAKQHHSVLIKASPADIIFSILSLNDCKITRILSPKFQAATKISDNILIRVVDQRLSMATEEPIVLDKAQGDFKEGFSIVKKPGKTEEHVFHDMPRATARITNQLLAKRVVFELRRKKHPMNDPSDLPPVPFAFLWEQSPAKVSYPSIPNVQKTIETETQANEELSNSMSRLEAEFKEKLNGLAQQKQTRIDILRDIHNMEKELEQMNIKKAQLKKEYEATVSDNLDSKIAACDMRERSLTEEEANTDEQIKKSITRLNLLSQANFTEIGSLRLRISRYDLEISQLTKQLTRLQNREKPVPTTSILKSPVKITIPKTHLPKLIPSTKHAPTNRIQEEVGSISSTLSSKSREKTVLQNELYRLEEKRQENEAQKRALKNSITELSSYKITLRKDIQQIQIEVQQLAERKRRQEQNTKFLLLEIEVIKRKEEDLAKIRISGLNALQEQTPKIHITQDKLFQLLERLRLELEMTEAREDSFLPPQYHALHKERYEALKKAFEEINQQIE